MTTTADQDAAARIPLAYRIACLLAAALLWAFCVIGAFHPVSPLGYASYAVAALDALIIGIALVIVSRRNAEYHAANTTSWIAGLFIADAVLSCVVGFGHVHDVAYRLALMLFTLLLGLTIAAIGAFGAARPREADAETVTPAPHEHRRSPEQARARIAEIDELARAEHAISEGQATPAQEAMVREDASIRAAAERRAALNRTARRQTR